MMQMFENSGKVCFQLSEEDNIYKLSAAFDNMCEVELGCFKDQNPRVILKDKRMIVELKISKLEGNSDLLQVFKAL
jgi:hypothetical protein